MRAARLIILAATVAACQTAAVTPPAPTRVELLQTAVETGVDAEWSDPCIAPLLWAVLDGHEGEKRLNRIITGGGEATRCRSLPAEARLLRRYRLGPINLRLELEQPIPEVRSAALALIRRQKLTALAEAVRALLGDGHAQVRLDAIETLVALDDAAAVPQLAALLERTPAGMEQNRLCAALRALDPSGASWSAACSGGGGSIGGRVASSPTREQEQLCNEENARVRGLLAAGDWKALSKPLLRFLSREYSDVAASLRYGRASRFVACRLHTDIRNQLLELDPRLRVPRAIVAATLLWQIHPRVGTRMLDASEGLPAASWGEPPWAGPSSLPAGRPLPTPFDSDLFPSARRSGAPGADERGQP